MSRLTVSELDEHAHDALLAVFCPGSSEDQCNQARVSREDGRRVGARCRGHDEVAVGGEDGSGRATGGCGEY